MSRNSQFVLAGVLLLIGVGVGLWSWTTAAYPHANRPPQVYVCRDSKEIFFSHDPAADLVHPITGRATLSVAVYCPHCETWSPAPPMDRLIKNSHEIQCMKCRSIRSFEGEIPDSATELAASR